MTFDLASARGWVAQNQVFAVRKQREGDMVGAQHAANLAAAEQAKIDALIEAKLLASELADCEGSIADYGARLWHLLDQVIPETDLLEVIEADVVDKKPDEPSPRYRSWTDQDHDE
jgi:hypothetical protein